MNHKDEFIAYLKQEFPNIIPEYKFCKNRKWRADFALVPEMIIFEYDGGGFCKEIGRHSRGAGMIKDNEKINTAQLLGWRVFRVCSGQSFTQLIDDVKRICVDCREVIQKETV